MEVFEVSISLTVANSKYDDVLVWHNQVNVLDGNGECRESLIGDITCHWKDGGNLSPLYMSEALLIPLAIMLEKHLAYSLLNPPASAKAG